MNLEDSKSCDGCVCNFDVGDIYTVGYEQLCGLCRSEREAENGGWIACTNWDDLPIGTWLVKIDKERKPYNVAVAAKSGSGRRLVIVGNCFSWDMGSIIAYSDFEKYTPQ